MSETAEGTFEQTVSVNGPATLDVTVDSGFIRVRAGAAGSIQIRGTLRARRSLFSWGSVEDRIRQLELHPPVEQSGNTVGVGDVGDSIAVFLEIAVPADTRIRAQSDSGDIRVEGAGPVDCETDSGDVEISAIEGNVNASSDSGDIRIRRVKGRVCAEADSGDIEALEIAGDIEVETDSGEILISQTVAAPIRAEADAGSISVKLAPDAGYTIRVETDHGRITAPGIDVNGCLRGGGPVVDLETDSGDIDIV